MTKRQTYNLFANNSSESDVKPPPLLSSSIILVNSSWQHFKFSLRFIAIISYIRQRRINTPASFALLAADGFTNNRSLHFSDVKYTDKMQQTQQISELTDSLQRPISLTHSVNGSDLPITENSYEKGASESEKNIQEAKTDSASSPSSRSTAGVDGSSLKKLNTPAEKKPDDFKQHPLIPLPDSKSNQDGNATSETIISHCAIAAHDASSSSTRDPSLPTLESLKYPRKSLPLLPRLNQYERHPILQIRSTKGMSEFELLLLEENSRCPRRCSAAGEYRSFAAGAVDDKGRYCSERKLVPRSAHSEIHPLFKRSDSGLYELEEYLIEKDTVTAKTGFRDQPRTGQSSSVDVVTTVVRPPGRVLERRSTLGKLEPRSGQYERNELLQSRDESGLSEMEKMLQEKHQESLRKCTTYSDCTCRNGTCLKCKDVQNLQSEAGKSISQEDGVPPTATVDLGASVDVGAKPAGTLLKRVRFQHQKSDVDEAQIAMVVDNLTLEVGEKGNVGNSPVVTVDENIALENDRKLALFKTIRTPTQRKSCCLS